MADVNKIFDYYKSKFELHSLFYIIRCAFRQLYDTYFFIV